MTPELDIRPITADTLLDNVRAMHEQGFRLVQISATRLAESIELTYSFDHISRLTNLRLNLPVAQPSVPSISSVYPCVLLYENEIHDLFGVQVENMAVDFHGNFYKTAVPYAFSTLAPAAKPKTEPVAKPDPAKEIAAKPST